MSAFGERDRRRHHRYPVTLKICYTNVDTFFYDYAVNISHCGVYIKTDSPLPIGSRVLLNFSIPGTNREIKTEGKVVRSISEKHHSNKMEPLGMGIEFDPLKEEDVALIKTLWEESTQP